LPGADFDLAQDAALLFDQVRQAGQMALERFRAGVASWHKPDGSVLTETDLEVDRFLKASLLAARPDYGWLSEETADDGARLSRPMLWIVDPIDGTRAFAKGGDEWCVTGALVKDGQPVAAAVYRPLTDDFYHATAGGGSFCNAARLKAGDGPLAGCRMMGTRRALTPLLAHGIVPEWPGEQPLLLRLARVAEASLDAALSLGAKNDWDLAAGHLLVQEAGGRMTDARNRPMVFNRIGSVQDGVLAAGLTRHQALIQLMERE